jgi:hypothetical protein
MGSKREARGEGQVESQERVMEFHGFSGDENLMAVLPSLLTRNATY